MLINCSNAMQCKGSLQTKKCVTPGGCLSEREFVNNKNGNIVVDFNLLFTSYKYRLFTLASGFWPLWPRRQALLWLDQPLGLRPLVWLLQASKNAAIAWAIFPVPGTNIVMP